MNPVLPYRCHITVFTHKFCVQVFVLALLLKWVSIGLAMLSKLPTIPPKFIFFAFYDLVGDR